MISSSSTYPSKIEMTHEGRVIADWKNRGPAMDNSGVIYLHRTYRTTLDGKCIVVSRQVVCFKDGEVEQLLAVPGTFARS